MSAGLKVNRGSLESDEAASPDGGVRCLTFAPVRTVNALVVEAGVEERKSSSSYIAEARLFAWPFRKASDEP